MPGEISFRVSGSIPVEWFKEGNMFIIPAYKEVPVFVIKNILRRILDDL